MNYWQEEKLSKLRKEITRLDTEILKLLNKRAEISLEIGKLKAMIGQSIFKSFREKDILGELAQLNPGPLPKEHLFSIYREILSFSRCLQEPLNIMYLGPEGTFSYFAAIHFFGHSSNYIPKDTVEEVFKAIRIRTLGIVPLENSLQGTVAESLDMFLKYNVYIQAEIFCRISHALLSSSEDLSQIKIVYSHPQALNQCSKWLKTNLPQAKIIPVDSTAYGAKIAQDTPESAAIGHIKLASLFKLNVIETNIEDLPENWTRFLIIGTDKPAMGNKEKTSFMFTIPDKPGSLAKILNIFANREVNLKKLESRPLRDRRWQYAFFSDVECDLTKDEYSSLMNELNENCELIKILGSYPNGPYIELKD